LRGKLWVSHIVCKPAACQVRSTLASWGSWTLLKESTMPQVRLSVKMMPVKACGGIESLSTTYRRRRSWMRMMDILPRTPTRSLDRRLYQSAARGRKDCPQSYADTLRLKSDNCAHSVEVLSRCLLSRFCCRKLKDILINRFARAALTQTRPDGDGVV
jgi:hypothetical protein